MKEINNQDQVCDLIDAITSDYENLNSENLKVLLFSSTTENLYEVIESVYAIDIANSLEDFENEEIIEFFNRIDAEHKALIIEQADERIQERIISIFPFEDLSKVFNHMSNDDITDILGNLPTDVRKQLLNLMKNADNIEVQKLLQHDEDTAGGIMTTEYISLKEGLLASDALKKIKMIGPKTEVIETIFVVNDKRQLIGTADLRDIFTAKDNETLYDIMDDNIITVTPDIDQEEVSHLVSKYDLNAIAVINKRGSLLGIITLDDIIDVLVEEQTEDILKLGGVSAEESAHTSVFTSIKTRLPWLLVNLVTAFLAAFVVSKFEGVIAQVVALSAMMPVVAGMGGNSGSQTLAIIIRGITLGELNLRDDWKRVFKEVSVGILNAFITGCVAGIVIYIMYGNIALTGIIIIAMILNAIVASMCGFFIPLTLKSLGLDPVLASNIFLTAATDTMAFLILLGLANLCIEYLI